MNFPFLLRLLPLLLLFCAFPQAALAFPSPQPPRLSEPDRSRLDAGEIIASARRSGDEIELQVTAVIDAPASEVWEIVRDFGTTADWVPDMKRSDVVERSEDRMVADAVTGVPVFRDRAYRLDIRVVTVRNGAFASHWRNVDGHGNINTMRGYWWVEPWGESGERSIARQVSWMDLGIPVPSGIVRRSAERELPATMEALRTRHRRMYR